MGRIVHEVRISSAGNNSETITVDALVDTGASITALPLSYLQRFPSAKIIEGESSTANGMVTVQIGGPFEIEITGFRRVFSEVAFLPNLDEPLIGYTLLEAIPVAVDMLGHRLVPVKYLDMK